MSAVEPLEPKQERAVATRLKLLDAAVNELLESGYAGLTTSAVARRAGVSRGAQQRYFPHKEILVREALGHLLERHHAELENRIESVPIGTARLSEALDLVFNWYSGQLFAAILELAFAARTEPQLSQIVHVKERDVSQFVQGIASEIVGPDVAQQPEFAKCWATALATARGMALLRLLGHPSYAVEAQWAFARAKLFSMLLSASQQDTKAERKSHEGE